MQAQEPVSDPTREMSAYFEVPGAGGVDLYTVLHVVDQPVARVLLVGPFASERHISYFAWVRWARFLASRGVEVLRYDYRGIGESTGRFEDMRLEHWLEDVVLLADWFSSRPQPAPVVLNGLDLGALLAGIVFDRGMGDGLMLWSPPASAGHSLRSTLLRWTRMKQLFVAAEERLPISHYIQQLEENRTLRVEGYCWTGELWRDAHRYLLPTALHDEQRAATAYDRPVRVADVWKSVTSLLKGGSIGDEQFAELDALYRSNWEWIASALVSMEGGRRETSNSCS